MLLEQGSRGTTFKSYESVRVRSLTTPKRKLLAGWQVAIHVRPDTHVQEQPQKGRNESDDIREIDDRSDLHNEILPKEQ